MKKSWYEIQLINNIDGYTEIIAKVKSKGLAYNTKMAYDEIYKNTEYKVIVR
jgi:hypothetical protein